MDAASVPNTGEVLIVHCLGLSSPKPGEQSTVSPSSTEEVGAQTDSVSCRGRSCGAVT